MALGLASHVKPVTKQTFGRASPGAAREAAPEALPNRALELKSPNHDFLFLAHDTKVCPFLGK